MSSAVYAGVPLALTATTSYNVGLILEKRALGQMPTLDLRNLPQLVASLLTAPAWLTGFALMLTGLACQTVALTIAPVSVVQPLLSSGVALLLVLSQLVLRERLGGTELCCIAAIGAGVVMLALSAAGSGTAGHYANPTTIALVMIPSAMAGLAIATRPMRARLGRHRVPVLGISYGLGTGLLYGVAALAIKAMSGILVQHHQLLPIAEGILTSPYLYVLAASSVAAMVLFQVGLQACRASIVVPVSTVSSSMYFMIVGTWLFHEHLPSSPGKLVLRLTGIAVTVAVLIALARQDPRRQHDPRRPA